MLSLRPSRGTGTHAMKLSVNQKISCAPKTGDFSADLNSLLLSADLILQNQIESNPQIEDYNF